MGPSIILPVLLVLVVVPLVLVWARRRFKEGNADHELPPPPSARLTSAALRDLPSPPWRVVHEIAPEKLGGIEHVLIGAAGVFAVRTSMESLPARRADEPDAHEVAQAAIARGGLDDALRRCAMSSDRLVTVHWGIDEAGHGPAVELVPGSIAVDGRSIGAWIGSLPTDRLSPAQVDLAWQTVVTAIGRPDPLS